MNCKTCTKPLNRGKYYCSHMCANKAIFTGTKKPATWIASMTGEKNPNWKQTSSAKYRGLHKWMGKRIVKPALCSYCLVKPPLDLANISGQYRQDVTDWVYLCRKCHIVLDGRAADLGKSTMGKHEYKSLKSFKREGVSI